MQHLDPSGDSGLVNGVNGGPIWSAEGQVNLPGFAVRGGYEPEIRRTSGRGETDDERLAHREADLFMHSERPENSEVEVERRLDVRNLKAYVVNHAVEANPLRMARPFGPPKSDRHELDISVACWRPNLEW